MSLYVHIPFCTGKCLYCDFYSITATDETIDIYLDALAIEAKIIRKEYFCDENKIKLETVYIGGGTPSRLSAHQLEKLTQILKSNFALKNIKEFTCEVNPDTISADKLSVLKNAGVNRISIGAQTFNDALLVRIGRRHNSEQIYYAFELVGKFIDNINIDLIFGLPGEKLEDLQFDLSESVNKLASEHLSCYELMFSEGTKLTEMLKKGTVSVCDEDALLQMHQYTHDFLTSNNYEHYEISNYARKGKKCLHNLRYWENAEYIGLGASATGYLNGLRYKNHDDIKKYCNELLREKRLPISSSETLSDKARAGETAMLALRKANGIDRKNFIARTGYDPFELFSEQIDKFRQMSLLKIDEQTIRLTYKGFLLSNEIIREFLL